QFEENGETKYRSGRGRAPKPIAEALAGGRSLDEFIIKKDASSSAGDEQ
ncbi:DNA-binding protein, partial [Escherichia coli]